MPPLTGTTDSNTSSIISESSADVPVQKRLRDEAHATTVAPQEDDATPLKKRRVSLPVVHIAGSKSASEIMPRSKSCNALKKEKGSLSPVQLLRTFQLEQKKTKFTGAFVKPTEKDLSSYDTAVVGAVRSSNLVALKSIHKEGKSLNACNQFGESLLHMACRRGNPEVVRFMVEEAKVNVNVRDDYGRTILHDATWTSRPNFDVMEILLKAIQPEMLLAEDVRGHTPFDYARKEHWADWVDFLLEHKEKIGPGASDRLQVIA
jgi:hypothetical protein